jgi:hypothetical protein
MLAFKAPDDLEHKAGGPYVALPTDSVLVDASDVDTWSCCTRSISAHILWSSALMELFIDVIGMQSEALIQCGRWFKAC